MLGGGGEKRLTGGFVFVDNTIDILISAKNYYFDHINTLKYNHDAELNVDLLVSIINQTGLVQW